jgi:hypothetical protein
MKDVVQREWDEIDAETERIFRKPQAETHEDQARTAWEKLFTRKPMQNKDLK